MHPARLTMNRGWSDAEQEFMRKLMDDIYVQFKGRVTESRGDRLKGDLDQLAGGRVFTGRQALERGLVDRIGGLSGPMEDAIGKAGVDPKCEVYILPKPQDFAAVLARMMGQESRDEYEIGRTAAGASGLFAAPRGGPLDSTRAALLAELLRHVAPRDAERVLYGLRNLLLLQQERVGMFMPFDLEVR